VGHIDVSYLNTPARTSLSEAVETADVVVLGNVTGTAFGFFGGIPGQLTRFSPEEIVKGTLARAAYYVFIPVGDFWVGAVHICKTDSRYVAPPAKGDTVLLFSGLPSGADGDILDIKTESGLVVIAGAEGTVHLPSRFRADARSLSSADALRSFVRETAARLRREEPR
jgi:hypothetical protein